MIDPDPSPLMKAESSQVPVSNDAERQTVSFPRFVFTCFLSILAWIITANIGGLVMALVFPRGGDSMEFGLGLDWRNLPGTILGFFAACRTWTLMIDRHLDRAQAKAKRNRSN